MKTIKLLLVVSAGLVILSGCKESIDKNETTSNSIELSTNSSESSQEETTQFEVGEKLFQITISDFNVIADGDMSDENGNTWLILQSDKYRSLLIQLSLHNKAAVERPNAYSLEELDIEKTDTTMVNYHQFNREELSEAVNATGKIYEFETEEINGQLVFLSKQELTAKEKEYFDEMIKSIEIVDR